MKSDYQQNWRIKYLHGESLRIGREPQLIFDDYLVEDRYGLKRVIGPVEKHPGNPLETGPVLPWEANPIGPNHILYDPREKLYKGWYAVCPNAERLRLGDRSAGGYNKYTLYAESRDGLHWEKPALDFFPFAGHRKTNIVMVREGETCLLVDVWIDPEPADDSRRFAALFKTVPPGENERCLVLMHSVDGRCWRVADAPPLFRGATDGSYSLVRNPLLDCWLIYRRPPTRALKKEGFYAGRVMTINEGETARGSGVNDKRHVSVCLSRDFRRWTHPRGIALPDEIDVSDVDSIKVIPYRDVFFGFIGLMDNPGLLPKHTQLMFSRDGLHWERLPDRPPFVANGASGEWDAGQVTVTSLVEDSRRINIYYTGTPAPQKDRRLPRFSAPGLAFLDKDRWVGQQAGPGGGYLLTRQFLLEGNRLLINCRCPARRPASGYEGLLRAEILAGPVEHNSAIPYQGFSMDDCDPVEVTDNPGQIVTWKGSPDLSALRGKPVYIRFFMRNATLYTLQIVDRAESR